MSMVSEKNLFFCNPYPYHNISSLHFHSQPSLTALQLLQNLLNHALTKSAAVIVSLFHRTWYHSTALQIHVSPECKAVLDTLGGFYLEERGPVTLKVENQNFPQVFISQLYIKIN